MECGRSAAAFASTPKISQAKYRPPIGICICSGQLQLGHLLLLLLLFLWLLLLLSLACAVASAVDVILRSAATKDLNQ